MHTPQPEIAHAYSRACLLREAALLVRQARELDLAPGAHPAERCENARRAEVARGLALELHEAVRVLGEQATTGGET